MSYMEANEDVGQIMPKVFYPDGRLQYLCKMVPTPMDLIFKRFLPGRLTRKRLRKFQLQFTGYDKPMNVPYLSGCFMFFRMSALQEIGLFDERFLCTPRTLTLRDAYTNGIKQFFIRKHRLFTPMQQHRKLICGC